MPLIGFVDDHGTKVTFEQAWRLKRFAGLPIEVLYKIFLTDGAGRPSGGLSVTELLGCARKAYLKKTVDYYENPRFIYSRFRGTMTHAVLEETNVLQDPAKVISEKRYHRQVPGTDLVLSGKIDKYDVETETLEDYKTIGDDKIEELVKKLPEDYIKQTNIYAWIMEGNGIRVKRIVIHFFSWKYCYTTGEDNLIGAGWFKPKWLPIPEVPMLRLSQIEDFLVHRVNDIRRQELPPAIEPAQRFLCHGCAFKDRCWPKGVEST